MNRNMKRNMNMVNHNEITFSQSVNDVERADTYDKQTHEEL